MKNVTILAGQTISDIAVQELGDAERSMEVANLNGMSLTDELVSGAIIIVPDYDTTKKSFVQLFTDPANKPASDDSAGDTEGPLEGIGYWYLENDFIVQPNPISL